MQQFETEARFVCPSCDKAVSTFVELPEPNWAGAESMSDLDSEGPVEISCPTCGNTFEGYAYNSAGNVELKLNDYTDLMVDTSPAHFSEDEFWSQPEPPKDPAVVFYSVTDEVSEWAEAHASDIDGGALINRMLFSSLITALEAYLGDTLRLVLDANSEDLGKFLLHNDDLKSEKFTLPQVASNPNLVKEAVAKYLNEVMYHNLPKVNALYRAAFDLDFLRILPRDDVEALNRAVGNRHHCVHRNGKNLEGEKLEIFTKQYIAQTRKQVVDLVKIIEASLFPEPEPDDDFPF